MDGQNQTTVSDDKVFGVGQNMDSNSTRTQSDGLELQLH